MTGGEAYKQKLLTDDALDAAIAAYLADPSKPVTIEVGKGSIDVAAADLANAYSALVPVICCMIGLNHAIPILLSARLDNRAINRF